MADRGDWMTFSVVGALAAAGAVAHGRRGSRKALADPDPLGERDGLDLLAFRQQLGFRPAESINDSDVVRQGRARVNEGFMWKLLSERMYGSWVDLPVIATREALQNSRDAIDAAWRQRIVDREGGQFGVYWDPSRRALTWTDNGVGMSEDVFYDKFLALGETTKQGVAGGAAGGFGIAKAVILGVSSTFRWEMHTRDRKYVASGFEEPVKAYRAPFYQGTKLIVYDVASRYDYWRLPSGAYTSLSERLKTMLASNNLRPTKGHARVRIFLDGAQIAPMFARRGKMIGEGLEWGPQTTAKVRAYRRSKSAGGGAAYVRLEGLYQFAEGFEVDAPFDVTVDLRTGLSPRDQGYPLVASRNSLSGPAASAFRQMRRTLSNDYLSATKAKASVEVFEEAEGDPAQIEQNAQRIDSMLEEVLSDERVVAGLELVKGGAKRLRQQQDVIQRRRMRRQIEQGLTEEIEGQRPVGQQVMPPRMQQRPMSVGVRQQPVQRKRRKRRGNPFAGIAVFKVNKAHFKSAKLRKYFDRPERYYGLIGLWRITCQLVLQELGAKAPLYQVGLILDDDAKAQYEVSGNTRTLYINPEWFRAELRAYKGRPLAIAAVLHAKACHEITHMLGQGEHNEGFVAVREQLAEETVNLLYPLTTLAEELLGIKPAGTAENRALRRLRAEVKRLKSQRKGMRARELVKEQLGHARRQLVGVQPRKQPQQAPSTGLAALLREAHEAASG